MNKADRDFAEKLVREVQKRPAIYVPSHPYHRDRNKIDQEWTSIATQLNSNVESVKRRWQNLRGSFSKSLALLKNQPIGSAIKPKSKFYLFDQMTFLQQHMAHAPLHGNYGMVEQGQDEDEQAIEEVSIPVKEEEVDPQFGSPPSSPTPSASSMASTTSGPPRAKKRPRPKYSQPWEEAAVQYIKNRSSSEDPDLNFFKGLLPMVKVLKPKNKLKFFGDLTTLLSDHIDQQDSEDIVFNISVP